MIKNIKKEGGKNMEDEAKEVKRNKLKDSYTWDELVNVKKGEDAYKEFQQMRDIGEALERDEIEALQKAKQVVVR